MSPNQNYGSFFCEKGEGKFIYILIVVQVEIVHSTPSNSFCEMLKYTLYQPKNGFKHAAYVGVRWQPVVKGMRRWGGGVEGGGEENLAGE